MIVNVGSRVTYRYIESNTTQYDRKILSTNESNTIRANKKMWMVLGGKDKKEFEVNNKTKFELNEIAEDSALGVAIIGLGVGGVGDMILPSTQGGIHKVEIIEIK